MPTTTEGATGRRLALVIATATYGDATLAKLRAPGEDASELAGVLGDVAIGGFEVETILDAPAETLRRQIARFCSQVGPSDLTLVYLSCHGVLDDRGRLYYAATDTDRALLSATAVPSAWLNEQLEDCRSRRQILVLDCCHSGAFAKGAKGESGLALRGRFEGRGRVVLTGSRGTEYSFEHDHVVGESTSSVFTGTLVDGLRSGDADRDGDGVVTVNELYDYVYDAVQAKEGRQTPTLWTYGAEGDLLIATSPRGPTAGPAVEDPPPSFTPPAPPSSPSRRSFSGRWQPIAIGAAAIAAAAVGLVIVLSGGGGDMGSSASGSGTIPMPGSPRGIAVGEGGTWVARYGAGRVTRIDSSLHLKSIAVGRHPRGIVAGEGSVWVSYEDNRKLARIDPDSLEVTLRVPLVSRSCDCAVEHLAIAQGKVWVGSVSGTSIMAFDLETGEQIGEPYYPGEEFEGVFAVGDTVLWGIGNNAESATSTLFRIDIASREVKPFQLGEHSYFSGVAYGEGMTWVADASQSDVTAFDPEKEDIVGSLKLNSVVSDDITVVGGTVFVWDPDTGVLAQIDAGTMELASARKIRGYRPFQDINHFQSDLAVDDHTIWVTSPADNAVYRVAY